MSGRLLLAILALAVVSPVGARTTDRDMDRFVSALMKRMTVEEKIGQLNLLTAGGIVTGEAQNSDIARKIERGQVGGLFNLRGAQRVAEVQKIAVENSRLGIPLLFGLDVVHGYQTVFPIPLGLSCCWDMDAVRQSARIAAVEASADGICWTFSPMVDVSRDARWGRVSEGGGEDAFLGGEIAKAMVEGYQGDGMERNDEIMACVKHFALYGASEAGRDYNTVDMSRLRMYNEYLYPYRAAVQAGVGSVMASFNELDGVPATANRWLLTDLLRGQWGFDGFVVSDFTGVSEMTAHGIGDLQTVSSRALDAGTDMDMVSEGYVGTVKKSLDEGKISMRTIDAACRRILEAKYKLGLFHNPYKYCDTARPARDIFTAEHRAAARRIASECFVLLKNEPMREGEKPVLPLARKGTVAVIGPMGNTRGNMSGTWSLAAKPNAYPSLYEGLSQTSEGRAKIVYAKGSNLVSDAAYEARAVSGKLLGRDSRSEREMLDEALLVAEQADVIVAALGECAEMSGESSSRTDLNIPDVQRRLLAALLETGKPVVLTLFTGRPLTLVWENENVPAILNVWFGGSEAAYAISDVLFGDVNSSGKLTMTFPKNVGQIPIYYNHKNTGRPLADGRWFSKFRSNYLDVDNEPLYPFGYGLSYTTFRYGDVQLSTPTFERGQRVTASVEVTNTGERDGAEVVQLYVRDLVGIITRPVRELKGFEKIFLRAGETKTVSFEITDDMLGFYDGDLNWTVESGDFDIMIGTDSRNVKTARLTLK